MTEANLAEVPPLVLVVDDEPAILKNLDLLLTSEGCRVICAANGAEALERAMKERPDVVLLDLVLPDIDGFEVCRRIKADPKQPHVAVLMLTSLSDVFNKVKGLDAGADDFISKPFNDGELRARVRAFLRTKRLHDHLDESYRRLKELEKLRDSLTHMMMHDLVAPLTAIQLGVESVLARIAKKEPLKPPHVRMLQIAFEGCRRLMDMLRDVLSVSRLEEKKLPLSLEDVNLKALIENCVETMEPTAAIAQVKMGTKFSGKISLVRCDPSLIMRVVLNLLSNSLKFTDVGGKVIVAATAKGSEVEVQVRDTGLGIPPENLEKVFDKFFQGGSARSARKGQGLGLAFCRLAIEAHGGKISVESEPGKGSRFIFRLKSVR